MSFVPTGGIFNIVRRVTVDEETLEKIAELLGIQPGQVISGTIYIGAPPSPPSGGTQPSATSGRRRQRK
jgi:hypothetical protein